MKTRRGAGALLAGSVGLGWLATRSSLVARLVQLWTAGSLAYTAILAWRGADLMRSARESSPERTGSADGLPFVTLMVPARDEAPVIQDIVRDLAAQRYGRNGTPHFEVLVIDDGSTDGTGELARAAAPGASVVRVVRRPPASGPELRGSALNFATPLATGEVIAAIDADARVDPDFVEGAMLAWARSPDAAAVQTLKRPVNGDSSWLTAAQVEELLLDMVSQCGRWASGGTGELRGNGMFIRRDLLETLGGWGEDALTEDLDMSTRLVAAGERIAVAPDVAVGEQAVASVQPLWHQRMRWAEGSLRRTISHGPRVIEAPISWRTKLDVLAFLVTESVLPAFLAGVVGATFLTRRPGRRSTWRLPAALLTCYAAGLAMLAAAGLAADGRRGRDLAVGSLRGGLFLVHWVAVVPAALVRLAFGPSRILYVKTPRLALTQGGGTRGESSSGDAGPAS